MLNMGEQLRNSGTPGIKAGKTYVGVVINNDDPLRLQRLQVRVSDIMDGWEDAHLPWAIPEALDHADGCTEDTGTVNIPINGAKVSIEFLDGNPTHPAYSGYHEDSSTVLQESKHNYPNRKVTRFKDGTLFVLDKVDNVAYLYTPTTVKLHIKGNVELHIDGNVIEQIDGNVTRYIKGNVDETIDGNLTQHVKGTILRKGNLISEESETDASYHAGSNYLAYGDGNALLGTGGDVSIQGSMIYENSGSHPVSAPDGVADPEEVVLSNWPGMREGTTS